jgi:hypothetical protein
MDALGARDERASKADGEVVWSRYPDADINLVTMLRIAPGTVTKKARLTEEITKETVKTIARGMPGVSGVTVVTNARVFYHHARLRAQRAPGIPCALVFGGRGHAQLGRGLRRESEGAYLSARRRPPNL